MTPLNIPTVSFRKIDTFHVYVIILHMKSIKAILVALIAATFAMPLFAETGTVCFSGRSPDLGSGWRTGVGQSISQLFDYHFANTTGGHVTVIFSGSFTGSGGGITFSSTSTSILTMVSSGGTTSATYTGNTVSIPPGTTVTVGVRMTGTATTSTSGTVSVSGTSNGASSSTAAAGTAQGTSSTSVSDGDGDPVLNEN